MKITWNRVGFWQNENDLKKLENLRYLDRQKNEDDPKNGDDPKNDDSPKNEDQLGIFPKFFRLIFMMAPLRKQLGPNHVCVIVSRRRDTITSVWYYVIMELYRVSRLPDSITETW